MAKCQNSADKEVLKEIAIQELRKLGFKHFPKLKKNRLKSEEEKFHSLGKKLFQKELHTLASKVVPLNIGVAIEVPSFVADACCFIEENIHTEGLFRKAGSAARQREIKAYLDEGNALSKEFHVIDVANILKLFFRDLPEPLIPFHCHEVFSRCLKMKDRMCECLLLCCLLLPVDHLRTLIYLAQFLRKIADESERNKMDITNLAIIMAPTLMPVERRKTENISLNGSRLNTHVKVIESLIRNSHMLGELPKSLEKKLLSSNLEIPQLTTRLSRPAQAERQKKKRRSESMTRVLSGLRRMVRKPSSPSGQQGSSGHSAADDAASLQTPLKKRKMVESSISFSRNKRPDALPSSRSLLPHISFPQDSLMPPNACGPYFSPKVCFHPNASLHEVNGCDCGDQKKRIDLGWPGAGKKKVVEEPPCGAKAAKVSFNPVRRWSSLSSSTKVEQNVEKLDRIQTGIPEKEEGQFIGEPVMSNEFSCVLSMASKSCKNPSENEVPSGSSIIANLEEEYQVIKSKVSAIENQLIEEFGRLGATVESNNCNHTTSVNKEGHVAEPERLKGLHSVQSKYERTLEEAERFSGASADQLAKQLSRELKIRRSAEHKVIRSPSARKIGSIRRRSRDSFKQPKVTANADSISHGSGDDAAAAKKMFQPEFNGISAHSQSSHSSLKRGRPNTIQTGLRHPSPGQNSEGEGIHSCHSGEVHPELKSEKSLSNPNLLRRNDLPESVLKSSRFQGSLPEMPMLCVSQGPNSQQVNTSDVSSMELPTFNQRNESNGSSLMSKPNSIKLKRAASLKERMETGVSHHPLDNPMHDLQRSESFRNVSKGFHPLANVSAESGGVHWHPAESFLSNAKLAEQPNTGRESVAKLRAQNAGKVLANVKLFEHNGKNGCERVFSSRNSSQYMSSPSKSEIVCSAMDVSDASWKASYGSCKGKTRRSFSESVSHANRQGELVRHQGRLSTPVAGKECRRKHRSFSSFRQKENVNDEFGDDSKENSFHALKENNFEKVVQHSSREDPLEHNLYNKVKNVLATPLKDSNRMNFEKGFFSADPFRRGIGDRVVESHNGSQYLLKTPTLELASAMKLPLTSLPPITSSRKVKKSPSKGIRNVFNESTPKLAPRRQSPRLLLRSRLVSNACM